MSFPFSVLLWFSSENSRHKFQSKCRCHQRVMRERQGSRVIEDFSHRAYLSHNICVFHLWTSHKNWLNYCCFFRGRKSFIVKDRSSVILILWHHRWSRIVGNSNHLHIVCLGIVAFGLALLNVIKRSCPMARTYSIPEEWSEVAEILSTTHFQTRIEKFLWYPSRWIKHICA